MDLRASVEQVEDVAAGFNTFRAPLPEYKTEITGLISDLYAISASLTSLDDLSKESSLRRNWPLIHSDLELVLSSLRYTIKDILVYFNNLNGRTAPEEYRTAWVLMSRFFWDEARPRQSLSARLATYKTVLRDLRDILQKKTHHNPDLAIYRENLRNLDAVQEKRLAPRFSRTPLGRNPSSGDRYGPEPVSPVDDRPRRRRSYERPRPKHQTSPLSPLSPSSGGFSDVPPVAPEAPSSPLTESTSATTTTTTQSTHEAIEYHWIKEIFTRPQPDPLELATVSEKAACFGDPHPGIKQWLQEQGFEQLLQLEFNDEANLTVYFYLRERDHRVRIVLKFPRRGRSSEYFCLPLNMLEVVRDRNGCILRLCRRRRSGTELVLWASLKFATIENQVSFFSSFLALRSQDAGHPVEDIRDYELEGEEELYGGLILDDDYTHALRVYQDNGTGAVRMQASIYKGEMERTPVWTAFITQYLGTRGWLKEYDSRTVLVRTLKPIILMSPDYYNPPLTNRGEWILKFKTRSDADSFLETMEKTARSIH
ncbi:hypothetical protein N7495_008051 [Penicillium taxi]|uniref:uncharacterized protein n=1 Tax=Penicillium taxi TaxID=168475 RepID=UPI00254545AC|nr:uncharacterized protein N7495_008051 [Penicillium taxi]KAJ5888010.1 hypothetical protein N7495_008051 [Penicillium taxi]